MDNSASDFASPEVFYSITKLQQTHDSTSAEDPAFSSQIPTTIQAVMALSDIKSKPPHVIPEPYSGTSGHIFLPFDHSSMVVYEEPIADDSRASTPGLTCSNGSTVNSEAHCPMDVSTSSTTPANWHPMDWSKTALIGMGSTSPMFHMPVSLPPESFTHQCIMADHAQLHIINQKHVFENILVDWGYEGTYSLHSGFNRESLDRQDPEEEIYIILESEVSEGLQIALEELALPFTGIIMILANDDGAGDTRSSETTSEKNMEGLDGLQGETQDRGGGKDNNMGSSGERDGESSGDNGGSGGGGYGSGGGEPGGKGNNNPDGGNDDSGNGGAPGSNGSDGNNADKNSASNQHPGLLHIPFSSRLFSKDKQEKFDINGHIKVTVKNEVDPNIWSGPLLQVDMRGLQATSKSRTNAYSLSLCQVHIMASSCKLNILDWSPRVVHAEDSSKTIEERNLSGAVAVTISMNPSLRIDGKLGAVKGTEREQQPWIISSYDGREGSSNETEDGKGILWKYERNLKGGFQTVTTEHFHRSPNLFFGLDDTPLMDLPELKVQVIIFWSYEKEFLSSLRRKNNSSGTLPANLNFLHQITMVVDLKNYRGLTVGVMNGTIEDEIPSLPTSTGGRAVFPEHTLELSSSSQSSNLEIVIKQAVEGRVQRLTREERSGSDLTTPLFSRPTAYPSPGPSPIPSKGPSPNLSH